MYFNHLQRPFGEKSIGHQQFFIVWWAPRFGKTALNIVWPKVEISDAWPSLTKFITEKQVFPSNKCSAINFKTKQIESDWHILHTPSVLCIHIDIIPPANVIDLDWFELDIWTLLNKWIFLCEVTARGPSISPLNDWSEVQFIRHFLLRNFKVLAASAYPLSPVIHLVTHLLGAHSTPLNLSN